MSMSNKILLFLFIHIELIKDLKKFIKINFESLKIIISIKIYMSEKLKNIYMNKMIFVIIKLNTLKGKLRNK